MCSDGGTRLIRAEGPCSAARESELEVERPGVAVASAAADKDFHFTKTSSVKGWSGIRTNIWYTVIV